MSERFYPNPAASDPEASWPDPGENLGEYPSPFHEAFDPRPPRGSFYANDDSDAGYPAPPRRQPRSRTERGPGAKRRSPRSPGRPPARQKASAARRLHRRYRSTALLGMMLFAAVGGMSLGFSGVGGGSVSIGLLLAAVPALLVSLGCAAAYIYF
jgi:hypothetical protein